MNDSISSLCLDPRDSYFHCPTSVPSNTSSFGWVSIVRLSSFISLFFVLISLMTVSGTFVKRFATGKTIDHSKAISTANLCFALVFVNGLLQFARLFVVISSADLDTDSLVSNGGRTNRSEFIQFAVFTRRFNLAAVLSAYTSLCCLFLRLSQKKIRSKDYCLHVSIVVLTISIGLNIIETALTPTDYAVADPSVFTEVWDSSRWTGYGANDSVVYNKSPTVSFTIGIIYSTMFLLLSAVFFISYRRFASFYLEKAKLRSFDRVFHSMMNRFRILRFVSFAGPITSVALFLREILFISVVQTSNGVPHIVLSLCEEAIPLILLANLSAISESSNHLGEIGQLPIDELSTKMHLQIQVTANGGITAVKPQYSMEKSLQNPPKFPQSAPTGNKVSPLLPEVLDAVDRSHGDALSILLIEGRVLDADVNLESMRTLSPLPASQSKIDANQQPDVALDEDENIVEKRIFLSRDMAIFWQIPNLRERLFEWPVVVNVGESRAHSLISILFVCVALYLDRFVSHIASVVFMGYTAIGFLNRSLFASKFDVQAWVVLFFVRPFLRRLDIMQDKFQPSPPRRMAHFISFFMTTLTTIFMAALPENPSVWILFVYVYLLAAFLQAFYDFCLGCAMFWILNRLHLIPDSVCEKCSMVLVSRQ